ncbi:hypothetical protein AOL_s00117g75 [Orbilia oligospora ATCC 24927]|uniref:Uncharacterized protein n=1 Tax=Arthrobotrys oligospora (strain ATCC 24927 / CBS 115.81 / DSM 1491) TaxID=756982 RepID=G1XM28_ARTOA|nr:hypothetical protein AOL_s00117g75 [Orbilia oligospora ATCC 24927]EGX45870.1 hypothetical protein AOL_s00117g75 [Orbilia oligospora ATCC 24927]
MSNLANPHRRYVFPLFFWQGNKPNFQDDGEKLRVALIANRSSDNTWLRWLESNIPRGHLGIRWYIISKVYVLHCTPRDLKLTRTDINLYGPGSHFQIENSFRLTGTITLDVRLTLRPELKFFISVLDPIYKFMMAVILYKFANDKGVQIWLAATTTILAMIVFVFTLREVS